MSGSWIVDCETFARVKELFAKAIGLDPRECHVFLEKACGGDEALLAEVESLLAFHRASDRGE